MIVSGVVVSIEGGKMGHVKKFLGTFTGLEVNSIIDENRMVIVLRTRSKEEREKICREIESIDGVCGLVHAYDHVDDPGTVI